MDKEGQNPTSAPVFKSEAIGSKPTTEYFSNVKGGREDQSKVEKKRTTNTRKTLIIILSIVAGILITVTAVFVILSLVNRRGTYGERTGEDLPTTIEEVEERAYALAFEDLEAPGNFEAALYYINNVIADMVDTNQDQDLIYAVRCFRAILAYQAGAPTAALNEALSLEEYAKTDNQKFSIHGTLDRLYIWQRDYEKAVAYEDKMDALDVSENKTGSVSGFIDEGAVNADQRGEETENIDSEEPIEYGEGQNE